MAEEVPPKGLVGVISLGCPKNLVDTETVLADFAAKGYGVTNDPEEADVLLVNTCGFIRDAKEESVNAILEMAAIKKAHPYKKLVVTGCLSQRYGASLAEEIPEIDVLAGTSQYKDLIPIVEAKNPDFATADNRVESPRFSREPVGERVLATAPHTAYVKIAEGCNNPCAFCIIPRLRGPYVSRTPEDIEREVTALAGRGVKEIILISQDTTLYGRDLEERTSLAALLPRLAAVEGVVWIRLLYLYPTLVTAELLETMAREPKVAPYLDIPLQHSHSAVLKRMRRVERSDGIVNKLEMIRTLLPDAAIRATFIVGFPGETVEEFEHLFSFVKAQRFDHLGIFTYSDEEDTEAFGLPDKVPAEVAEERKNRLMECQQEISREKLAARVGETVYVLMEGESDETELLLQGRTMGQAPEIDGVTLINDGFAEPGEIVPVVITEAHDYDLVGHVMEAE